MRSLKVSFFPTLSACLIFFCQFFFIINKELLFFSHGIFFEKSATNTPFLYIKKLFPLFFLFVVEISQRKVRKKVGFFCSVFLMLFCEKEGKKRGIRDGSCVLDLKLDISYGERSEASSKED